MKKIFFALALVALLFSGCHKEKEHKGNGGGGGDEPGSGGGDEPTLVVRCVTGDANGISWKAAVLNGQLVSEDESIRLEEDLEPAKTDQRRSAIRGIEKTSRAMNQTQIFIETPYRSDAMLAYLAQTLSPSTRICIAADLTLPGQTIFTMSAADWKKHIADGFQICKRPCVSLILSQ